MKYWRRALTIIIGILYIPCIGMVENGVKITSDKGFQFAGILTLVLLLLYSDYIIAICVYLYKSLKEEK